MNFSSPHTATVRRAFTLLEVLAASGLAAALAGIALGAAVHALGAGQTARARSEMATIAAALEEYRHRYGDFPHTDRSEELLQSLLGHRDPTGEAGDDSSMVDLSQLTVSGDGMESGASTSLLDPWRRPYVYIYKVPLAGWTNPTYFLGSLGAAGSPVAPLAEGGYFDGARRENASVIEAGGN